MAEMIRSEKRITPTMIASVIIYTKDVARSIYTRSVNMVNTTFATPMNGDEITILKKSRILADLNTSEYNPKMEKTTTASATFAPNHNQ